MQTIILYDNKSTNLISKGFILPPGFSAVISAWGLGKEDCLVLQKLAFPYGQFPNASFCTPGDIKDLSTPYDAGSYAEDVTDCGCWNVNACHNTRVLTLPGTYRLELSSTEALTSLFVSVSIYSRVEYTPSEISSLVFGG